MSDNATEIESPVLIKVVLSRHDYRAYKEACRRQDTMPYPCLHDLVRNFTILHNPDEDEA